MVGMRALTRLTGLRHSGVCARLASSSSMPPPPASSTVDPEEVNRFESLSQQWANENDSFKALHSLNKLRVPWIVDTIASPNAHPAKSLQGLSVADVGCGGGLLSIPMARLGAHLTGIDASPEAVRAARAALAVALQNTEQCGGGDVQLEATTVEQFAAQHAEGFDAVVASEIVEHVADVNTFVEGCATLARPGAPLFFTTINRTMLSKVLAVWMAEEVLGIVPQGVHDWSKFVTPDELRHKLDVHGCDVRMIHGMAYNPFTNHWAWTDCTQINYALMAVKRR